VNQPIPSHQYVFEIPPNLDAMWSARAIYTTRPEPFIDILPDRQCMYGDHRGEEAKRLCNWLNNKGLKGLQQVCKEQHIAQDESRIVEFQSDGFIVRGTPNASYGYLYIVAYRVPIDTPSS